ncbi:MAG TPA: hypothetical protein DDW55_11430 [Gammaproteobacteria bacterium]|nr:hypothetical protein [Gammaproteobacteria bacterium]
MVTLHPLQAIKFLLLTTITILASLSSSQIYAADVVVLPEKATEPSVQSAPPLIAQQKGLTRRSHAVAQNHILIKLSTDTSEPTFLEHAKGLGLRKLKQLHGTNWYMMAIPVHMGVGPGEMTAAAKGLPGVMYAAADPILYINDTIPPNDPFYVDDDNPSEDCDFINDPECSPEDLVDQWGLFRVEAEAAWTIQTGSPNVVIAVLDSGIDKDHDDLLDNIWTNPGEIAGNGLDDDGNGWADDIIGWDFAGNNVGSPDDDPLSEDNNPDIFSIPDHQWISDPYAIPFGYRFDGDAAVGDGIDNNLEYYPQFFTMDIGVFHGTAVAGIAAMMANNINPETGLYEGMVGACWHCKIMPVRVINAEGEALGSDIVEGISYAVDNGADIINASWGIAPGGATPGELAPIEEAIRYAVANDVIVIAAAGNGGAAGLYFPASMPETISVGSSNWGDVRSTFSTYALGSEVLDLVAPGETIWSSGVSSAYDAWVANYWLLFPELWYEPHRPGEDTYIGGDGTSFAAPLVSGYAGLILSQNPCATAEQVRQVLRDNTVDIGTPGYDNQTGYGRMHMAVPDLGCLPGAPTAGFTFSTHDLTVTFTDTSSDSDGLIASWSWDFGDASPLSTVEDPTHIYATEGTYNVTLTVTDNDSGSNSITKSVTVTEPVVNPPSNPPIAPSDVTVADQTNGRALINWSDNSDNEDRFDIMRQSPHKRRSGVWVGTTDVGSVSANVTTYDDASGAGTFRYCVSSANSVGSSDWNCSEVVTITDDSGGGDGGGGTSFCDAHPDHKKCP